VTPEERASQVIRRGCYATEDDVAAAIRVAEVEAVKPWLVECDRLRAACFSVLVSCGADVDGARSWQEFGESRLADAAVQAAADLRDDYQEALKEIPDEGKKEIQ